MPQIAEQKIEGGEAADTCDQTVEEGEGEIAFFGNLSAQDEVRDAHRGYRDEDAEGEDEHGTAGANAKGDHAESSRARGAPNFGARTPRC